MSASFAERALVFDSHGWKLAGIVAQPAGVIAPFGVLIVVGGPQYRAGSHRQFTLLARQLAVHGIASCRFDYHGLGDSDGPPALGVMGIGDDIRSAIDTFMRAVPALQGVVLWGLCGAASASCFYAPGDARVRGLAMLNPWVRTEDSVANARLRHYYGARLADRGFWRQIVAGKVDLHAALGGFARTIGRVLGSRFGPRNNSGPDSGAELSLPEGMLHGLRAAGVPALLVLSGDADLTANEFRDLCRRDNGWRRWRASAGVHAVEVEGSDHTFAKAEWRDAVAAHTIDWLGRLGAGR